MNTNQSVLDIAEPARKPVLRDVVRSVFGRFRMVHSDRLVELCNRYDTSWYRYVDLHGCLKRCTGKKWIRFRRAYMKIVEEETGMLTCAYCGKTHLISNGNESSSSTLATLDHVKPLSKGGRQFGIDNIVICCLSCNARKGDKDYTMRIMKVRNPIMYYLITLKYSICKFLNYLDRFLS